MCISKRLKRELLSFLKKELFDFFVIYRVVKPDYMSLEIKTNAENGVIIWQGQVSVDYFYSRKIALTDITKGNKSFPF